MIDAERINLTSGKSMVPAGQICEYGMPECHIVFLDIDQHIMYMSLPTYSSVRQKFLVFN